MAHILAKASPKYVKYVYLDVYLFPFFFLASPNKKLSTWQQTHVLGLSLYLSASMTTLLTHITAHSTKPSFRPKTNNQPLKKVLSLVVS